MVLNLPIFLFNITYNNLCYYTANFLSSYNTSKWSSWKKIIKHILNIAKSLKFQSNLPTSFWGVLFSSHSYFINLLSVKSLNFKTSFELLYQQSLDYLHLKVFGCLYFATKVHIHDKFESKAIKGVLLEYSFGKK